MLAVNRLSNAYSIIEGCREEILSDLSVDKIGGQIPVLGIPFNMMCAKAMTYQLGILFAMLSARSVVRIQDNLND